jgi:hypothetical protein
MSEIPAKKYSYNSEYLNQYDVNPWLVANKHYSECVNRFLNTFPTKNDALKELERSDINNTCKRELNDLRDIAPTIRYKEAVGGQLKMMKNFFLEELEVKKKP